MAQDKQVKVGRIEQLTTGSSGKIGDSEKVRMIPTPIGPMAEGMAVIGAMAAGELKDEPAVVTHLTVAPHSVEISRNASGGVSVSVKCYGSTPEEAAQMARSMFQNLDQEFPKVVK